MLISRFFAIILVKEVKCKVGYKQNEPISETHKPSYYFSNFFDSFIRIITVRITDINSN